LFQATFVGAAAALPAVNPIAAAQIASSAANRFQLDFGLSG
jgi:hypothetical protein